jgi:hypothetical protein
VQLEMTPKLPSHRGCLGIRAGIEHSWDHLVGMDSSHQIFLTYVYQKI